MKRIQPASPDALLPDELPGFALHAVLALLGGDRRLLRKLLLQFAGQFADGAGRVANLVRDEKRQEAADYLHCIKGAAANLGATAVQQTAVALESQLKSGTYTAEAMVSLEDGAVLAKKDTQLVIKS